MYKIDWNIFRAYDIRGTIPQQINPELAEIIGLAYANFMKDSKEIVVGKDLRKSGKELKEALIKGLVDGGKEVIDIGTAPTPLVYFTAASQKKDGCIQITGSHLPSEYNGFKLKGKYARTFTELNPQEEIKKIIQAGNLKKAEKKGNISKKDIINDYVEYVSGKIKLKKKLKIVVDCGNGTAGKIPGLVFRKLGCEVIELFTELDDSFPNHVPDPYEALTHGTMDDLMNKVKEEKADLGIGFDGDVDRIGAVDNQGRLVSFDNLLLLFSENALEKKKENGKNIVFEVRTSQAVINYLIKKGANIVLAEAGYPFILAESEKQNAIFGGETTGHVFFMKEYFPFDDAIFAACKLAEITSEKEDFAQYIDSLPKPVSTPDYSIECSDDTKFKIIEEIKKKLTKAEISFIGIDGARMNFENGWALVRASNTAPNIKVRMEADSEENLSEIRKKVVSILEEFKELDLNSLKK